MKKNSLIKITLTNLVLMFSFVAVFAQPDTALDYHLKLLDKYPIFMSYCDSSTSSNFIEYCFSEEVDSIIDFKASQAIGQSILLNYPASLSLFCCSEYFSINRV